MQFCEICGYIKNYDNNFFFTPLFCCCFWIRDLGSEIRDPGSGMGKNQDPGSGINIPDPQHCEILSLLLLHMSARYRTLSLNSLLVRVIKIRQNTWNMLCGPAYALTTSYWGFLFIHIKSILKILFHVRNGTIVGSL